jgi:hypothetical protein
LMISEPMRFSARWESGVAVAVIVVDIWLRFL